MISELTYKRHISYIKYNIMTRLFDLICGSMMEMNKFFKQKRFKIQSTKSSYVGFSL